jgi:hypothetical protein
MDCDHSTDLFDATTIDHWLDFYQAFARGHCGRCQSHRSIFSRDATVNQFIEAQTAFPHQGAPGRIAAVA